MRVSWVCEWVVDETRMDADLQLPRGRFPHSITCRMSIWGKSSEIIRESLLLPSSSSFPSPPPPSLSLSPSSPSHLPSPPPPLPPPPPSIPRFNQCNVWVSCINLKCSSPTVAIFIFLSLFWIVDCIRIPNLCLCVLIGHVLCWIDPSTFGLDWISWFFNCDRSCLCRTYRLIICCTRFIWFDYSISVFVGLIIFDLILHFWLVGRFG